VTLKKTCRTRRTVRKNRAWHAGFLNLSLWRDDDDDLSCFLVVYIISLIEINNSRSDRDVTVAVGLLSCALKRCLIHCGCSFIKLLNISLCIVLMYHDIN
jgi:hypothetical protein